LSQTWKQWECIIVDDGSTDNTAQIANSFQIRDARIKYIYQKNQGLSVARNTGINISKGDYIQLLDADDKLEIRKLERQLAYLEQHPSVDIVYGDVQYFRENNLALASDITKRRVLPRISGRGSEVLAFLVRRNIMVVNAPLVRMAVFKEIGPFNQQLNAHEDWEYWLRCALANKTFAYQNNKETCALVRVHPNSMVQNVERQLITDLMVRDYLDTYSLSKKLRKQNNYRRGFQLAKLAKYYVAHGSITLGLRNAVKAVWAVGSDARIIIVILVMLIPMNLAARFVLGLERLQSLLLQKKMK
jgi:glycosyltransferase involved in cell wall biosynthesis